MKEDVMYQFVRTVEAKNAAYIPAALKFAGEVTAYLNKAYAVQLHYGIELFSGARLHWHLQTDSLDALTALNGKLMQDREYAAILERARDLWVEGSFRDTVISMVG
jgi:hypothetical protein